MRIWVTGIGVVSPLGHGARATWERLLAGESAIRQLTLFDPAGCRSHLAAEVPDLSVAQVAPPGAAEEWSRTDAMAALAAREALEQAGVDPARERIDLCVGSTTAGMFETEDLLAEMALDPHALAPMRRMLSHPLSATADRLQSRLGPFGQARTVCSACSSGANALLLGAAWLHGGRCERVLCGGADGLCRLTYFGFNALAALSPEPCRPFDAARAGLSLGEAAAFLVLELEAAARARGAEPVAELCGWAVGAEAHHITNPEPSGEAAARVMVRALRCAGIGPAELDYVNAHGTGTRLNDAMEARALRICLGADARRIAVSSSKGQIGHTLGAAGAIEAAFAALAVAHGAIPPTIGLRQVDPDCELEHVRFSRRQRVRAALSSSFGFGGTDTVLVLAEPGRLAAPADPSAPRPVYVSAAATLGPAGLLPTAPGVALLESGPAPAPGGADFRPGEHLDLERARRIDRGGRMAAAVLQAALRDAGLAGPELAPETGAVVGSAFGSVDACAAYVHRAFAKGAKFAAPADFPNLVPSSPGAHASIYLRLGGPVVHCSDLGATAESAMVTAVELLTAGAAEAIVAGSVEEASRITEHVLAPLCSETVGTEPRGEGAAVVLFETEGSLRGRGGLARARVWAWSSWRGAPARALADLPGPERWERAAVLLAREDERARAALGASAWGRLPRL
ncbi:MAG: 3-oxoacyl-ACP synthase, partial [Deltaproteobacteria bacterium]|nr:3-oxoacyl-ACP synthase [Deltaproteobacteria bacterium]